MTAENTPAASLPTSRQRCDMRRAAMVLAAAVIPVAGAAPAQAALVNVPATHPALGQTAAVGIAATPAVAPARHLPTIPIQTAPSTVTRYVDVNMANVRSGPSMSNSVVGSVSRGTKVTGTIVNGWLKTSNGRYIGLSVLRSGSGSSSSGSSSSSSTVTRYVTAGAGNVRSGAGLGYRVVGTLSRDTKVTGTMTSNGWLKMSNGRYISSVILTSSSPSSSSSSGSSTVTRYVTAGAGNVRSGAGLGYRVVGTLSRDTKVTGTMTSNG
ncbi:hypothetical protein K0651_03930, partial [Ornithinimicrobium sp. Arc0846-15]|nr:hypothetical protein [Ornithinimicrobium laminariae]